jgi:hypothetical protein
VDLDIPLDNVEAKLYPASSTLRFLENLAEHPGTVLIQFSASKFIHATRFAVPFSGGPP